MGGVVVDERKTGHMHVNSCSSWMMGIGGGVYLVYSLYFFFFFWLHPGYAEVPQQLTGGTAVTTRDP